MTESGGPSVVDSPVTHMAGSAVTGLVVGAIVAVAIRHAHDPASSGLTLPMEARWCGDGPGPASDLPSGYPD